jgi:hypothetical protein
LHTRRSHLFKDGNSFQFNIVYLTQGQSESGPYPALYGVKNFEEALLQFNFPANESNGNRRPSPARLPPAPSSRWWFGFSCPNVGTLVAAFALRLPHSQSGIARPAQRRYGWGNSGNAK